MSRACTADFKDYVIEKVITVSQTVLATFENGVLVPDAPLPLPAQARVRLTVEPIEAADGSEALTWDDLERLWDEASIDSGGKRPTRDQLHERR